MVISSWIFDFFTKQLGSWCRPCDLSFLNHEVFGSIFKRKMGCWLALVEFKRALIMATVIFLENLEKELQQQLTLTLYQEECIWYQKSRGRWIVDGDRNIKYYHSKTIIRIRKNRIVTLRKIGSETWFVLSLSSCFTKMPLCVMLWSPRHLIPLY